MKLITLGTGSPEPYQPRASASYLIDTGDTRVMFDCGGGAFDRLIQAGYMPMDLDILCLSHLHSDHMIDYGRLVHARWDKGGHYLDELKVYGPEPMAMISDKLFGKDGAYATDLRARCEHPASQEIYAMRGGQLPRPWPKPEVHEVGSGFTVTTENGITLTNISVPHCQPWLNSFGWRLDFDGKSVCYSGDSGPSKALNRLAQGADYFIHMCFQLSQEAMGPEWIRGSSGHLEVARAAQAAGVKNLVISHLRESMDTDETRALIEHEVAQIYTGNIIMATDLMCLEW
ncbi:MAG TPA: MBL fold metallo-hydrolase [Oceanospirillaceae bacterium]|nr:MBL fold metallo-hydrolase [Oceanospirillaceae bacterium]